MKDQFFTDVISLSSGLQLHYNPGVIPNYVDRDTVRRAEDGIRAEIIRFRAYLMKRLPQDRTTILEYTTNELIMAYHLVRRSMKNLSNTEKDKGRPSMNVLYDATYSLIYCAKRELKIGYSQEFILSLKDRGDTFFAPYMKSIQPSPAEKPYPSNPAELQNKKIWNIDKEKLGVHFKSQFKGMGNGQVNYLGIFEDELKTPRSAKAFAQIAAMCYAGHHLKTPKPKFVEWYKLFCDAVGCERKSYDSSKKLLESAPDELKDRFSYLQ
jgi:hypothetical protein